MQHVFRNNKEIEKSVEVLVDLGYTAVESAFLFNDLIKSKNECIEDGHKTQNHVLNGYILSAKDKCTFSVTLPAKGAMSYAWTSGGWSAMTQLTLVGNVLTVN